MPLPPLPRVGIVDSGGPGGSLGSPLAGARRFFATQTGTVASAPAVPDRLGHGTRVEAVLRRALPGVIPVHAQVFDDRPVTSAARVAAAVTWLVEEAGVRLICLSLGLPHDRQVLRDAVNSARATGAILVAAAPAQGVPCYPAAYPGVIAATGDARCGFDDISLLGTDSTPVVGAWCASPEHPQPGLPSGPGGASIACARVTAHVASLLFTGDADPSPAALIRGLAVRAVHRGAERRRRQSA